MSSKHTSHGHNHHHAEDHGHSSLKGYATGFGLSVILTAIPFWLVMAKPLEGVFTSSMPLALILMAFALVQMVVHMVFFLHMHPKSEGGWTMMSLFFTLILVVITMSGSMWVMYHLNTNMMPTHDMSTIDTTGESQLSSQPLVSATTPAITQPQSKNPAQ